MADEKYNNMNLIMRSLPSVDALLNEKFINDSIEIAGREKTIVYIREILDDLRKDIKNNEFSNKSISIHEYIIQNLNNKINIYKNSALLKTINATGVVIHTNLGRSPISSDIIESSVDTIKYYSNLEFDIKSGSRGSRHTYLKDLLVELTGAEDALIVNNNAAAVLLILSTFAKNKEVIVSRGELVEIGGSFRVPDVMTQGQAKLIEVGTTNKTHAFDYENAINENTAILMKIHTSNFKITGFTKSLQIKDLREIADKHDVIVADDLGSGVLFDLTTIGLPYEPTVQDSIKQGADIVCFSGDKLLGGPQAGIIVGKKELIEKMKKNQLLRALRVDKIIISFLYNTLKLYKNEKELHKIPVINMLSQKEEYILEKANNLLAQIHVDTQAAQIDVIKCKSQVGGGTMPTVLLDSYAIAIKPTKLSVSRIEEMLRTGENHIICRIQNDTLFLDLRTIFEDQMKTVSENINEIFKAEV